MVANGSTYNLGRTPALKRGPAKRDVVATWFPFPTRPANEITAQARSEAIEITYAGNLRQAMDLYSQCVTEDGRISGILRTLSHGILGLPLSFQGDPEMCTALLDADRTVGDFRKMHPISEVAQIFEYGITTNFGLGQYLLMCWRCDEVKRRKDGTCQRCGACAEERPLGQRKLFRLMWRDPRWIEVDTLSGVLWYTGDGWRVPIVPGDGEWLLFQPYPQQDAWRHGPWIYITLAAIFARDGAFDRQRTSEQTTPTPVARATKETTYKSRREFAAELREAARARQLVLPEEWLYEIVTASHDYSDVASAIVDWASDMVEVGLTGNVMGLKAQSAFTDAGIYKRATTDRRRFYARTWLDAIGEQGLPWWGLDNYGTRQVPIGLYDVESPEDKLAASRALEQEGKSLQAFKLGLDAFGLECDPGELQERLQRAGWTSIRQKKQNVVVSTIQLAPSDIAKVVRVDEARVSQGLPQLGDSRGDMMISELEDANGTLPTQPLPSAPLARRNKR